MKTLKRVGTQAVNAAESLTGKRFGLLVASSLVATTAIVATGLNSASGGSGPLAALLAQTPAAETTPVTPASTGGEESFPEASGSSGGESSYSGSPTPAPVLGSSPSPTPTESRSSTETPAETPTPPEPTGPVGPIKHVVVISLSSPGYEQSFGATSEMPYLSTDLVPKGQLVPGYSLLDANPLPNNVALISGQRPNADTRGGCTVYTSFPTSTKLDKRGLVPGSGCIYPVETLTLSDQVGADHMLWRGYMEDMADESGPHNCVQPQPDEPDVPAPGGYAASLNPFVYFHSLLDIGDCATNDLPIDQLTKDLKKPKTTPQFAFVAPNLCHSGLTGQCPAEVPAGAAASDEFLAEWVPKILKSKAINKEGLVVILPNGLGSPEAPVAAGTDPLKVGALLISRYVTAGGTRDGDFNPYSVLKSIEELFALSPLAEAGAKKTESLGADLLGPQY